MSEGAQRPTASGASEAERAATGAAFFDLDKTLMEGSSALHFARAAYKAQVLPLIFTDTAGTKVQIGLYNPPLTGPGSVPALLVGLSTNNVLLALNEYDC